MIRRFVFVSSLSVAGVLVEKNESRLLPHENHSKVSNGQDTGWDRVKRLISLNEQYERHPDMQIVLEVTTAGFSVGFIYGGVKGYLAGVKNFIHTNDATSFFNINEARRQLGIAGINSSLNQAFSKAVKLGAFSGAFMFSTTAVATYRGKSGIIEYPICTGVIASLARFNLGIRGMLSGLLLGSLSGLVVGTITWTVLKVMGLSMDDLRDCLNTIRKEKNELLQQYQMEKEGKKMKENSNNLPLEGIVRSLHEKHGSVGIADLMEDVNSASNVEKVKPKES